MALVWGAPVVSGLAAQGTTPQLFEPLATFSSKRLNESSGVAVSRLHPGVIWTHNDSGDEPAVYAVDLDGSVRGMVLLRGARAVDWEDIAISVCPGGSGSCIYIADTGDNKERRRDASIYILPEPAEVRGRQLADARRVVLQYPNGPRDVEALAVRRSGEAILITKGRSGPVELYRIDPAELQRDSARVDMWTSLPIVPQRMIGRLVTGAALHSSDSLIVVRTYTQIFYFGLSTFPAEVSLKATCWLGAYEPQGEAVDFLDDSTLVLSSEGSKGRPAGMSKVRCPMDEEPAAP
jgi:hypothetical protein